MNDKDCNHQFIGEVCVVCCCMKDWLVECLESYAVVVKANNDNLWDAKETAQAIRKEIAKRLPEEVKDDESCPWSSVKCGISKGFNEYRKQVKQALNCEGELC